MPDTKDGMIIFALGTVKNKMGFENSCNINEQQGGGVSLWMYKVLKSLAQAARHKLVFIRHTLILHLSEG